MSTPEDDDATRLTRRGARPVEPRPADAAPDADDATVLSRRGTASAEEADDATRVVRRAEPAPDDDATRITRRPAVAPAPAAEPAAEPDDDATRVTRRPAPDDDATRITRKPAAPAAPAVVDDRTAVTERRGAHPVAPTPAATAVAPELQHPTVRTPPPVGESLPDPEPHDGGAAARLARRRLLRTRLLILIGVSVVVLAGSLVGLALLISA